MSMNPPLTLGEHERITKLIEEASEIIQAGAKVLLHGYDSVDPKTGITNRSQLETELGHLWNMQDMMHSHCTGEIDPEKIHDAMLAKREFLALGTVLEHQPAELFRDAD